MAERVAQERGENIGQAVGYQIRLESKLVTFNLKKEKFNFFFKLEYHQEHC